MGAKAIMYEPVTAWNNGIHTKNTWFNYNDIRDAEIQGKAIHTLIIAERKREL